MAYALGAYMGTMKGEKLNEPKSDLSSEKKGPNPAWIDSVCRVPSGRSGPADLYHRGDFSLQYREWPLEKIGSKAEGWQRLIQFL